MAGKIPQPFIDELLDRTDIVELIDSRVKLKKAGKNYTACCPFHEEKTPSFTVSPDKQFYYCFGCGAAGNALGFLMEYEHQAFPEAVESLAQQQGLEVPREQGNFEDNRQRQDLYTILDKANAYYQEQLRSHRQAEQAQQYLQQRGLTSQVAHQFGIGFAPDGWDNLMSYLGRDDLSLRQLVETGMVIHKPEEQKTYDRFRHRIMFPIRDVRGRVIAFGGRVLGDEKPKYLNSPETEVFHKGRELYGLYEANKANRHLDRLVVVEGYMDVVMLARHGVEYAAATLGTAAGAAHLEKAFRYTKEVVFCFDGDDAGRRAAERALEASLGVLTEGRQVRFMFLPEGEDPDSLVNAQGKEDFESRVQAALPLSEYLFDCYGHDLNLEQAEGRSLLVSRIAPLVARVPEGNFKDQLARLLATQSRSEQSAITDLVVDSTPPEVAPAREHRQPEAGDEAVVTALPQEHPRSGPQRFTLAEEATSLLLQNPDLVGSCAVLDELEGSLQVDLQQLKELVALLQQRQSASLNKIMGAWYGLHGKEGGDQLYRLAAKEQLIAPEQCKDEFEDILTRLVEREQREKPLDVLIEKARNGTITEAEKQQMKQLLQRQSASPDQ